MKYRILAETNHCGETIYHIQVKYWWAFVWKYRNDRTNFTYDVDVARRSVEMLERPEPTYKVVK